MARLCFQDTCNIFCYCQYIKNKGSCCIQNRFLRRKCVQLFVHCNLTLRNQLSSYHFYIIFVHRFNMGHEVTLVCESHFTSSALKRLDACVLVHVTFQIFPVCKTFFTYWALVSINSFVSIFVPV